jgi:integrase
MIRKHLLPFFGRMRLSEIGPADVQMFLTEMSKRVAPRTVLSLRNRLSKIFSVAVRWGYVQSNPVKGAQVPELADIRKRMALSPKQFWALSQELAEPYRTMALVAVLSGLRSGEVFGLRWRYVDFEERSILVAETVCQGRPSAPKTRASNRKVFIEDLALEALKQLQASAGGPDNFVFCTSKGTPFNPNNVRNRVLIPACRRAGIPPIGWHDLRRTFATWSNPTGESLKALQTQLGHTDSRLTLGVYTQPMPEAQRQLAAKVERVLLPVAPKSSTRGNGSEGVIQ